MRGWVVTLAIVAASALALLAPWPAAAIMTVAAVTAMRRRAGFLAFTASTISISAVLLAWLSPGPDAWSWGILAWGWPGAVQGAIGGLRIVALFGLNTAVLSRYPPALWLEELHLPRRAQGFLAAVLIAAQDIGRDFQSMKDARRLDGDWPEGRFAAARAGAGMLPGLLVASTQRARRRSEALRMAGVSTGPLFAPIVAVTALGIAGRLALLSLPNVALTFVVVFAGGVAFGARVGAWAGFWSMLLTDLMISGLAPSGLVNVPTMALFGAAGGMFHGSWAGDRGADRFLAGALGIVLTFLWSIATDAIDWALIAEFRGNLDLLRARVLFGLIFNVAPAIVNGLLFATAIGPIGRAFTALDRPATRAAPHP